MQAVDFFCGAGGVTCGFKQANIDVIVGIDIDKSCKDTYEKNNPGTSFLEADISKLKKGQLERDHGIIRNDDDMIFIGCSPCQYYTNLNTKKEKSEASRMLLEDFREFVDYYRPGYIFVENVPGIEKKKESPPKPQTLYFNCYKS